MSRGSAPIVGRTGGPAPSKGCRARSAGPSSTRCPGLPQKGVSDSISWGRKRRKAPVAQLDRALASGARSQRFDSSRAYQKIPAIEAGIFSYPSPVGLSLTFSKRPAAIGSQGPAGGFRENAEANGEAVYPNGPRQVLEEIRRGGVQMTFRGKPRLSYIFRIRDSKASVLGFRFVARCYVRTLLLGPIDRPLNRAIIRVCGGTETNVAFAPGLERTRSPFPLPASSRRQSR